MGQFLRLNQDKMRQAMEEFVAYMFADDGGANAEDLRWEDLGEDFVHATETAFRAAMKAGAIELTPSCQKSLPELSIKFIPQENDWGQVAVGLKQQRDSDDLMYLITNYARDGSYYWPSEISSPARAVESVLYEAEKLVPILEATLVGLESLGKTRAGYTRRVEAEIS